MPHHIVKLIEPSLCLSCRFAQTTKVTLADHTTKTMLQCTRLDCDNHQIITSAPKVIHLSSL